MYPGVPNTTINPAAGTSARLSLLYFIQEAIISNINLTKTLTTISPLHLLTAFCISQAFELQFQKKQSMGKNLLHLLFKE